MYVKSGGAGRPPVRQQYQGLNAQRPLYTHSVSPFQPHLLSSAPSLNLSSPTTHLKASFSLASIPQEALLAGGALVGAPLLIVGVAGVVGLIMKQAAPQQPAGETGVAAEDVPQAPPPPPRENAVLVLGATGRLGRRVVQQLLKAGKTVIAGVRSETKATEVFTPMGISAGYQADGSGILFIEQGLDVTKPETLRQASLWQGVKQVVCTLGGVFGPLPGGGFGAIDGLTSERVEAEGISQLMSILPEFLPKAERSSKSILPMATASDLEAWEKLDDVIMGGNSSSRLEPLPADAGVSGAVWKGDLIIEGGGFCGTRTKKLDLDLSAYDGLHMRVKGDGQIFKFNIKTVDQENTPESTYQATFDTVPGTWTDVYIPWHNFVPVKRAQSDPEGAPLDPSRISKFGLVLSRFEFNKMPNPAYKPGPYELWFEGGINAYTDVRPQVVMISSAGVERNAKIADDEIKRAMDIPIVQLNPGGTLNHKYTAEIAVRSSGYPYSVVRSTGMIDSNEGGPFLIEADQGDSIVGQLSRDDAAMVLAATLDYPEAVGKTFEIRRCEALDAKGQATGPRQLLRMFSKLAVDRNRWRVGLQPFPKAVPPPPPVTEQRRQEILAEVARIRGMAPPAAQPAPTAPASNGAASGNGAAKEVLTEREKVRAAV